MKIRRHWKKKHWDNEAKKWNRVIRVWIVIIALFFTVPSAVLIYQFAPMRSPGCSQSCLQQVFPVWALNAPRKTISTCNNRATYRGPGQRVVAFSFYDMLDDSLFSWGVKINAQRVKRLYPGWTMRVYHAFEINEEFKRTITILERKFPHLDLCHVGSLPAFGKKRGMVPHVWRFLPMADPLVDVFISRSILTQPTAREVAAVTEWLASNISFHVMRDNIQHNKNFLIGLWGARMDLEREMFASLTEDVLRASCCMKPSVLKEMIWEAMEGKVMQHDSYFCQTFFEHGNMRPWPTKRHLTPHNFVGFREEDTNPFYVRCPRECRPAAHQDWRFC